MSAAAPQVDHNGAKVELNMAPAILPFNSNLYATLDAAAAVTADADPDRPNIIKQIHCGYDATPAAGCYIRIEDGAGNTVWKMPIADAGIKSISFDLPKSGTKNTAMIVTLSDPGGAIVSYLYADIYKHL